MRLLPRCLLRPVLVEYVESALIKVSLPHLSAHVEGLEASATVELRRVTTSTRAEAVEGKADTIVDAIQWIVFIHTLVFANVLSACSRKYSLYTLLSMHICTSTGPMWASQNVLELLDPLSSLRSLCPQNLEVGLGFDGATIQLLSAKQPFQMGNCRFRQPALAWSLFAVSEATPTSGLPSSKRSKTCSLPLSRGPVLRLCHLCLARLARDLSLQSYTTQTGIGLPMERLFRPSSA